MNVTLNELRERIKIVRPITMVDDAGNLLEESEAEVATVWAKILPYAAKISNGYAEKIEEINYRIVIRYREDVTVSDRIYWRGRIFYLTAPPYDMKSNREYLAIEARELVEDG